MSSWFTTSSGDFNVTLITVNADGFAGLIVDGDGSLQVSNITFDVGFKDIAMKFDNLGFFGSMFQVKLSPFIWKLIYVCFGRGSSIQLVLSSSIRSSP